MAGGTTITNLIEKLNNRFFRFLLKNQKQLEAMGVDGLIEENRAYLRDWLPFGW